MCCEACVFAPTTQYVEGEMVVMEGEGEKPNSEFDTTFLDEKSNLNRSVVL